MGGLGLKTFLIIVKPGNYFIIRWNQPSMESVYNSTYLASVLYWKTVVILELLQLRQSFLNLTYILGVPVIKYRTEEHNQIRLISRLKSTSPNRMTVCITANSISWIAKGPTLHELFGREK